MAGSIAGTYQHVKNENFVEYLNKIGIPEDKAKKADALRPKVEVTINGSTVSLKSDSGLDNATSTFILDQEVDEKLPFGDVVKSTAKLDGNVLTVTSKNADGNTGKRVYTFTDTEMIVTLTTDGLVAKRFYKRV